MPCPQAYIFCLRLLNAEGKNVLADEFRRAVLDLPDIQHKTSLALLEHADLRHKCNIQRISAQHLQHAVPSAPLCPMSESACRMGA